MKLVSLSRNSAGSIFGKVVLKEGQEIDVLFSINGDDIPVVHAEPYIFGHGYSATASDVHTICKAVLTFDREFGNSNTDGKNSPVI